MEKGVHCLCYHPYVVFLLFAILLSLATSCYMLVFVKCAVTR